MIGQEKLIEVINNLNKFPRFSIVTGSKNSGRKTLVKKVIAKKIGAKIIEIGQKVDDIRELKNVAHTQNERIIYLISDADNMRIQAKDALLKLVEEPPRNTYVIITLLNNEKLTETLKSRAVEFIIGKYTEEEIDSYISKVIEEKNIEITDTELDLIKEVIYVPGEFEYLYNSNALEVFNFAEKVVENISIVNLSNALKIASSICLKETDTEGYDSILFFRFVINIYYKLLKEATDLKTRENYFKAIQKTYIVLNDFEISGIVRQYIVDNWILYLREIFNYDI